MKNIDTADPARRTYPPLWYMIPDQEDVPDPEERDEPTPLEKGDTGINLPPIPDRGFPGEDQRVIDTEDIQPQ